jgi:hypothetical protein
LLPLPLPLPLPLLPFALLRAGYLLLHSFPGGRKI